MVCEKATYSYSKVREACSLVKGLHTTCAKKLEHFPNAAEFKDVSEKCFELTGCVLFDYEWAYPVQRYFKSAYDCKRFTCKELDGLAHDALRYLQNELNGILTLMASGEVNSED